MSNTDAWKFSETEANGIPVYTGGSFFQFDSDFSTPYGYVAEHHLRESYGGLREPWRDCRLVYRDVAASTNERTCIAAIMPPPNSFVEMARVLDFVLPDDRNRAIMMSFVAGILNSFCVDFVFRHIVTSHLSNNIVQRVPIPRLPPSSGIVLPIAARVNRLTCLDERFADYWAGGFRDQFVHPSFWYPEGHSIEPYGPAHEQEIRERLRDTTRSLSPEWTPDCGVDDRLPDRRDTSRRAQLRAEIDGYVAHLYGLSRSDFAYILDTFPGVKNKEMKAFGEFISKRKCLEEYDRIGKVLAS